MPARSLLPVTLVLAVVACTSQPPPPPVPVADILPPAQTGPEITDGTYNAMGSLQRGDAMRCGTQLLMTFQVKNNSFTYVMNQPQVPYRPRVRFVVNIAADGSFESVMNTAALRGTVRDGHMQGELIGDACAFSFQADRGGTW